MAELGRLHAPLLGDAALADAEWLNRESPVNQALIAQLYAGFVERYGDQITPAHREVCERFVASFDASAPRRRQRPCSRACARRLPAGQHAVRGGRRRPAAHRGRLADRRLGARDDRCRPLLLGFALPNGRSPPTRLQHAAARHVQRRLAAEHQSQFSRTFRRRRPAARTSRRRDAFLAFHARSAPPRAFVTRSTCVLFRRHSQHMLDTGAAERPCPRPAAPENIATRPQATKAREKPVRSRLLEQEWTCPTTSTRGRG